MPKRGYKQGPEHRAKLARFRTDEAMKGLTAARLLALQTYMTACALRYGLPDVDSYRAVRERYERYRQKCRQRGADFLDFEGYLKRKPRKPRRAIPGRDIMHAEL